MGRRMPVRDPVQIKYTGPVMFHRAYVGPVTGNGYYADPEQVIDVERADFEVMAESGLWEALKYEEPEKPKKPKSRQRAAMKAAPGEEA